MHSRIDQITKGLISLTVMLMFTVALVAGQARANLPQSVSSLGATETISSFDTESLRRLESLPHLIELVLALPIDVEIRLGDHKVRNRDAVDSQLDQPAQP